ncbi:MAG: hypothetical protein CMN77_05185 [Spirochaetaceae bacterium]|nr:hypothetical protein [Spirochaetaceae bacterium]
MKGIHILKAANRAHLVRKVITNKKGRRQTVYVNPEQEKSKAKAPGKSDTDSKKSTGDREAGSSSSDQSVRSKQSQSRNDGSDKSGKAKKGTGKKPRERKYKDQGVNQIWAPADVESAKAQAFYNIVTNPNIGDPIPRPGRWNEGIPEGMPSETWEEHFTGHPDEGGEPKESREFLHNLIKQRFLEGKPTVPSGEKPVAIMMMGGPASGKSTMVKSAGLGSMEDFVVADADAVKNLIPEYRVGVNNRLKKAAEMAHEESSYLVKQIREEAINARKNLVIDGTGSKTASYEKNIQKLRDQGYEIKLMMADTPMDVALDRAKQRARKTGRYVPDGVLKGAYAGIPSGFQKIAEMVDSAAIYDTNVKLGEPSRLVYTKTNASETIHDSEHYSKFRNRIGKSWLFQIIKSRLSREQRIAIVKGGEDMEEKEQKRTDAELLQALARDEWGFTEEEMKRIEAMEDVAGEGEGVEMVVDD